MFNAIKTTAIIIIRGETQTTSFFILLNGQQSSSSSFSGLWTALCVDGSLSASPKVGNCDVKINYQITMSGCQ